MKKVISFLLLCTVLSSCGVFRSVKKDTYEHDVKTSEKTEASTDIKQKTIDKGSTTDIDRGQVVTERTNTKVTESPGVKVSVGADMVKLKNGETMTYDTLGARIKVGLDSLSGIVRLDVDMPPQKTTETNTEKVTEQKDRQTDDRRDQSTETNQQASLSQSSARDESLNTDNTEKEPNNMPWYAAIVAMILAVVALVLSLINKLKR